MNNKGLLCDFLMSFSGNYYFMSIWDYPVYTKVGRKTVVEFPFKTSIKSLQIPPPLTNSCINVVPTNIRIEIKFKIKI